MTREDTTARVTRIIIDHLGVAEADVRPDTLLLPEHYAKGRKVFDGRPDLGADSLDIVELVMAIEDEFGVEIPDDEITALNRADVAELVDFVHAKRAKS